MEILKNCVKWYFHTGWSNQIAIGIIIIAIIALITKYGLMKMGWSWLKISSPWKLFGKIVSLAAIVGVCYGIYLLVAHFWPTPEKLAFKELSGNLAELELQPEKDKLASLNEKVKKGERLTEKEKRWVMEADKKIETVRKNYSEGKLAPPAKPIVPVKTKWIFGFKAEPEDIINARKEGVDQISYRENDVINKPYFDKNEIRFKYKTSKEKVIYAILDKKSPSETHFLGMADLPDQPDKPKGRKLIIRLRETSAPDSFEGLIETWDGKNWYPQIPAFLKKVQIQ